MAYDANKMFKGAASLAAMGMKVAKIYGLRDNMTCTCEQGGNCKTPGKHPVGKDWGNSATDDEEIIAGWFDDSVIGDNVRWNIGVRLGPSSGVIDVEADDDEAMRVMERFELDQIHTLAFKGSRGPHYLFRYDDDLPAAGVVKVGGLEVRIGGGFHQTQSVFPPSQHGSGAVYEWLPGRSPNDAGIADLPSNFKDAVMAASRGGRSSGTTARALAQMLSGEMASVGHRHDFLLGVASELSRRLRLFKPEERQVNFILLSCVNQCLLEQPKSIEEVMKLNDSQFDFFRDARNKKREERMFERLGLDFYEGVWEPGRWHMVIVHSDPTELRLFIPGKRDPSRNEDPPMMRVSMSVEEAPEPKIVASKILGVGIDVLAEGRKKWSSIWGGYTIADEDGREVFVPGIFSKLHEAATHEWPSGDEKAYVTFARNALTFFNTFTEVHDEKSESGKPSSSGHPKIIRKPTGETYVAFKWNETFAAAFRAAGDQNGFTAKRSKDFKLRIEAATGLKHHDRAYPGLVGRYTIWKDIHMEKLREMASE